MRIPLLLALLMASHAMVFAIDVNPSKQSIPDKFINPPGKRFNLFSGDPTRVQRANEVNLKDFRAELTVEPASLSLANPTGPDGTAISGIKLTFRVQSVSKKRAYTLAFPDAQRFDFAIAGPGDSMLWLWSADKMFTQEVDSLIVNPGESVTYLETIPIEALRKAGPGTHRVMAVMANYPEFKDAREISLQP